MADAGDTTAQSVMKAYGADDSAGAMSAKAAGVIGQELEKVLLPFAQVLANIDGRLKTVEAQPVAGGPLLRPVAKTIAGQQSPPAEQKPAMPSLIREELDRLDRLAKTASNPLLRKQYDDQSVELRKQDG